MPGSHIPALHGTTWTTTGHKEGAPSCSLADCACCPLLTSVQPPDRCIPRSPQSPDVGILLLPPFPQHPKHDRHMGEQQEGQQSPITCEELLCARPGCPHAHLGVTHGLCSEPQVSPARSSAAIEGLHRPLPGLSLITGAALGSSPPEPDCTPRTAARTGARAGAWAGAGIGAGVRARSRAKTGTELQTVGQAPRILLQRGTPEDPEQHPKDLHALAEPLQGTCLSLQDT